MTDVIIPNLAELAGFYHGRCGLNVLALSDRKLPVSGFTWKRWQTERQDEAAIADILRPHWWQKAKGVGATCGTGSGGVALTDFDSLFKRDPDKPKVARAHIDRYLEDLDLPLDYPWVIQTANGGWHVWVLCPELNIPKSVLDRPAAADDIDHIELRFTGAIGVLPGSLYTTDDGMTGTYVWANGQPDTPPSSVAPERLMSAYNAITLEPPKPSPRLFQSDYSAVAIDSDVPGCSRWGLKALEENAALVSAATEGNRHKWLIYAAGKCGQVVASGHLDRGYTTQTLCATAATTGLPVNEITKTIEDGIEWGMDSPREPEERPADADLRQHEIVEPWDDAANGAMGFSANGTTPPPETDIIRLLVERRRYDELRAVLTEMPASVRSDVKEALLTVISDEKIVDAWLAGCSFKNTPLSEVVAADLNAWGYTFSEDETDNTVYVNDKPIDEAKRARIKLDARNAGYGKLRKKPPLAAVDESILALARQNLFHPVRDWLAGLTWDGHDHYDDLVRHFADKHPLIHYQSGKVKTAFRAFLWRWLLGAVYRAYGEHNIQNPMLVLGGEQGIGKSYFAQWLCSPLPGMFVEQHIDPYMADHARLLATRWIWEVGELGSVMRRQDREALKRFVTQTTVTFRVPYAKDPVVKPALANFIGTINNEAGFLTDPTGNRRFMVVELTQIDHTYTTVDITQVWAQAVQAYKAGETYKLSPEEVLRQNAQNDESTATNDTREAILKYYDLDTSRHDWFEYTVDIVQRLNNHGIRTNAMTVGIELRRLLGYVSVERRSPRRGQGFVGIQERPVSILGD